MSIFLAGISDGESAELREISCPSDAMVVGIDIFVENFKFGAFQSERFEAGNFPIVSDGVAGISFDFALVGCPIGQRQFDVGIGFFVEDGIRAEFAVDFDGDDENLTFA